MQKYFFTDFKYNPVLSKYCKGKKNQQEMIETDIFHVC